MIRYDTHALTGTSIDTSTGTIHLLFRRINWSYKYSEVLGFQEHQTCTAMEDSTTATASNKRHSLQDEEDCPVRTSKRQRSRLTEVAAVSTDRQNKNEEASAIYKLSNDELKLCFGCLGQYQYRYIAGASHRFKHVYDEAVEEKKKTASLVPPCQCPVRNNFWRMALAYINTNFSIAQRRMVTWILCNGEWILAMTSMKHWIIVRYSTM